MKIAVIGAGSMGMAFVRSWLTNEIHPKEEIVFIENSPERISEVKSAMQIEISGDYTKATGAQIIFLAVKPQDFKTAGAELSKVIRPDQVIVSIMAGVVIESIRNCLAGHERIVRVMPNLPILVASGISAYFSHSSVEVVMINILEQLLKAGGQVLKLESEDLLNAVTAISGSGPGYVFYALNHLMQVSKKLGFNDGQAKLLISSTINGSIELWQKDGRSADELCKAVTSKGGTTEAALQHFEKNQLGKSLEEGILQANLRAEEILRS